MLSTPGQRANDQTLAVAAELAATETLIQPTAEGLALFAEFDCCVPDPAADPAELVYTAIDWISLRLLSLKASEDS